MKFTVQNRIRLGLQTENFLATPFCWKPVNSKILREKDQIFYFFIFFLAGEPNICYVSQGKVLKNGNRHRTTQWKMHFKKVVLWQYKWVKLLAYSTSLLDK